MSEIMIFGRTSVVGTVFQLQGMARHTKAMKDTSIVPSKNGRPTVRIS